MDGLLLVSLVPLFGAFGLGAIDGLYFHLRRYRLFAHPESRYEHALHTVRAILVLPPLTLLYLADAAGWYLWAAAACIALDQVALVLDLRAEATSRGRFGGLSAAEYQIHVGANGLHAVALALALASRPSSAWSVSASALELSALPVLCHGALALLWVAAAVAAIQHVVLTFRGIDDETALDRASGSRTSRDTAHPRPAGRTGFPEVPCVEPERGRVGV